MSGNIILGGVSVVGQITTSLTLFDITFAGINGSRDHDLIEFVSSTISPSSNIAVQLLYQGSPINTIAQEINVATTTPGGVAFFSPTKQEPIFLPMLASGEGFPFWVQRITSPGTSSVESDNFVLSVNLTTLKPS